MIDISYIEDEFEVENGEPRETGPPEPPSAARPRWHRAAAFVAGGAILVGLFAFASTRTKQPDRLQSADRVRVGDVYTFSNRFDNDTWLRVSEITLTGATADGDPAALFVVEGRGWFSNQPATLTAEACETGEITVLGSWAVGQDGSFRFAETDPGGGTYHLTVEGLAADPVHILIGPRQQRVLDPLERGCPQVA